MSDRVALYLQDAHALPEAIEYVKYAEGRRLRGGLAGGEPAGSRCCRAHGGLRGGDQPHQSRLGRHQQLDAQCGRDRGHLPHAGRPGARSHPLRHRRLVGSAGGQSRHSAAQKPAGHARGGHCCAAASKSRTRHLSRANSSSWKMWSWMSCTAARKRATCPFISAPPVRR